MVWLWLLGCTSLEEQDALWMTGAYYDWEDFNHRVSALRFGFAGQDAQLSVIGGTSTTDTPADLDETCDAETCSEFPFVDVSDVRLGWGRIVTDQVALGTGTVRLDAPQGGATGTVDVELPASPKGEVTALIRGFSMDSDRELSGGPACYRPEYGWHPLNFALSIDDVALDGTTASVTVTAQLDPGITLETERQCIDAIVDQAIVGLSVDVLVLAGVESVTDEAVTSSATYTYGDGPFSPDEQEEVAPAALALDAPVVGWADVAFAFDSGEGRGSYLRSFGFELGDGGARGIATNYSPVTQITGMSYTFAGTARGVQLEGTVETGTVAVDGLEADLDANDDPVYQRFPR